MPKIPSYDIVTAVNPTPNQQVNLNVGEGVIDKSAITHPLSMFNIANDAVQEKYQQTKKAEQLVRQSEITTGFMREAGDLVNGLKTENIDIAKARYSDFYQNKHQQIIDSIQDPLEKAETSAQLNRMSFKYEQDMVDNAFALQRSKNLSSMEESLFEIEKQASLTGDPVKRRVYLDAARSTIESRVAAGDIDPLVGAKRIMGLNENVEVNSIMSVMNDNPSAALSMLDSKKSSGAISADKIIQLKNMAENEIKQKQSAAMSVVKDAFKKVSSGYDLPPEEMALVDKAIAQSGSPEIQAVASNMFNAAKVVGDLKYQTPQQIEAFYNTQIAPSLKKDGANAYEIMVAESVQNLASNMNTQLKKNPLEWDAQLKGNLDPVSIAEIVQNPVKMKERFARAAAVASYYNSDFVAFTDAEADKLSNDFTKLKNPEKAAFLQSLSSAAEGYPLGDIAKQIAGRNPVLAGAIAIASDSPIVAAKIASGYDLDIPKPSIKDFQADVFKKINNAIADPEALKTAVDSVYSYYNSLAYESNTQSDVIDSKTMDKAIADVIGPVLNFNDQSVLSYKRSTGKWADEETFSDLLSMATIDDVIKTHSDYPQDSSGRPLSMEDIRDRARFIATSQAGVYTMKYNNNFFVSDSSGAPFRFKMKELDDAVLKGLDFRKPMSARKTEKELRLRLRELNAN